MTRRFCTREAELWEAVAAGRWPLPAGEELSLHVTSCRSCSELVSVTAALIADGSAARRDAVVPSAAIVWWRAQMRARQEAARAITRPITFVQGLAIACAAGVALGLAGFVTAWLRDAAAPLFGWSSLLASAAAEAGVFNLTSRWVMFPAAMLLATALLAPLVVYLITADE